MADRETQPTSAEVDDFLSTVADPDRRADAHRLVELMRSVTGAEPVMWGSAIIGFGDSTYSTADGKVHAWFTLGFSPRKANLSLYGLLDDTEDVRERLGPHTTGKGCLYLKRLDDADEGVLTELVGQVWSR